MEIETQKKMQLYKRNLGVFGRFSRDCEDWKERERGIKNTQKRRVRERGQNAIVKGKLKPKRNSDNHKRPTH